MPYKLAVDEYVEVKVSYVDAAGNPAVVDGDVVWESSNPDLVTVTAHDDTTSADVCPAGNGDLGTAQISATADADLGEGVRELITVFDVQIVAGEAVAGTISPVGDPQPIPPNQRK
jgi:hypothetical protein